MHVTVLAGGNSDERAVSLRSGEAVSCALAAAHHHVTQLDTKDGFDVLLADLKQTDVVFPALHGLGGEDGVLQQFLESHTIPYVGSDSASSALCFDKHTYGELLGCEKILMPRSELVDAQTFASSALTKQPYVLKPNNGGSSIDTFIVHDPLEANTQAISAAFDRHGKLLLQELIVGTEITVAVLHGKGLPVIEIIPPIDQEFDYDNKYNGATQELCPPLNVSDSVQQQAKELAVKIHALTGCKDMSRTDMMIRNDQLFVLETNTIPGLTNQSLLPKAALAAGFSMTDLCDMLVKSAVKQI